MEKSENQLMVLKCKRCQGLFIPPKYNCPQCTGPDFDNVGVSGKGKVKTYTIIRVPPLGFENQVPYEISVIELLEGINLTARLVVKAGEEPTIGGKVKFLRDEGGTYWFECCS